MNDRVRFCDRCSKPITGEYERVPQFSASGARPDSCQHKPGDPACKPWPSAASTARRLTP